MQIRTLSWLFPLRYPKPIPRDFIFEEVDYLEDGIGKVKTKPYKDAIDRHWKTMKEQEEKPRFWCKTCFAVREFVNDKCKVCKKER